MRIITVFFSAVTKIKPSQALKHTCTKITNSNKKSKTEHFKNNQELSENFKDMQIKIQESIKNRNNHQNVNTNGFEQTINRSQENYRRSIYN